VLSPPSYLKTQLKQVDDPEQKNEFILTDKDTKDNEGSREQYTRKAYPRGSNKSENEEILVDSSSLLLKKMHNEKPERFGIPSNEREAEHYETELTQIGIEYAAETSDVGVLSDSYPSTHTRSYDPIMSGAEPGYLTNQEETPVDQAQSQVRRLVVSTTPSQVPSTVPSQSSAPSSAPSQSSAPSTVAFKAFQERCEETSDGKGYVDCDDGFVSDNPSTSCATACMVDGVSKCCTGTNACNDFTGKGKNKAILSLCIVIMNHILDLLILTTLLLTIHFFSLPRRFV